MKKVKAKTKAKTKAKPKKKQYWAIKQAGKANLYEGTFSGCWSRLVSDFGKVTVGSLSKQGITIGRTC